MGFDSEETIRGAPRADATSSQLLQRLKLQDPVAWQRFTTIYGPLVYYWCRRYGLQWEDAADVFQEVFSAIWSGIGEFEYQPHRGRFRGWLWTVIRHKVADHYRRRSAQPDAAADKHDALDWIAMPEQPPDESTDADQGREIKSVFRRAVEVVRAEFEPHTWEAFWRVTIDRQPCAEVAAALGMTPNNVRQAKSRVLRRLRDEMGDLLT